jgi:hypothetical protein
LGIRNWGRSGFVKYFRQISSKQLSSPLRMALFGAVYDALYCVMCSLQSRLVAENLE